MMTTSLISSPLGMTYYKRNVGRRERHAGCRERHARQRERFGSREDISQSTDLLHKRSSPNRYSYDQETYLKASASHNVNMQPSYYRKTDREADGAMQFSYYKDSSTIEQIRKTMSRTQTPPPPYIPAWLVGLDLNLDISQADIIPPYEESGKAHSQSNALSKSNSVSIAYDMNYLDNESSSEDEDFPKEETEHIRPQSSVSEPTRPLSVMETTRPASARVTDGRESRLSARSTRSKSSPRRYQGDMRVMSMQTGGIRSTPFQPKSKKYINQMLSYTSMKVHRKNMKSIKPAVDTKMPTSFKIALERKKLVETRLSRSWNKSYNTESESSPTPRSSSLHSRTTKILK